MSASEQSLNKTRELTKMALMIAINCISAYLIIPLPWSLSPIALQTCIVTLTGYLLKPKQAFITMAVYILVGLAGIPVFTGGTAGPGKLFGPTGGYIFGFVVAATVISYFKPEKYNFTKYAMIGLIGIPIIYIPGVIQLMALTKMDIMKAFMVGAVTFIPLDIVKVFAAAYLAGPLLRIFGNK
ncbi:MAG: biotin transporter BioY [Phascolarctobacterium sp.]|nr:biotin transporter BioY [Phascolarctobacterium sp.]